VERGIPFAFAAGYSVADGLVASTGCGSHSTQPVWSPHGALPAPRHSRRDVAFR
jgi:hypothetical protein